MKYRGTITMF